MDPTGPKILSLATIMSGACLADVAHRHPATIRADAVDGGPGTHHRLDSNRPTVGRALAFLDAAQRVCRPGASELGAGLCPARQASVPRQKAGRGPGGGAIGAAQPRG